MMNPREEELFGILQEESAEVIQVVSKRKRFPENRERNVKELHQEIGDFFATVQLLVQEGYVNLDDIGPAIQRKLEKLEKNMKHKRVSNDVRENMCACGIQQVNHLRGECPNGSGYFRT